MFMKEKFETGKERTVLFVSSVACRSSLVTISSFLYAINWSFVSTIWKINTSNASEGRLSSRHNLPVKAKSPTFNLFTREVREAYAVYAEYSLS